MITTISNSGKIGVEAVNVEKVPGRWQSIYIRYFFVAMALVFIAITSLGFVPQLVYIHAQKIHLHWFTHVHGAVMTSWLFLFLGQAVLAGRGQLKLHRTLGVFSVAMALVVWVSSIIVIFSALIRDNPPEQDGQFATVALSLVAMAMFGLFFYWAVRVRKNAMVHKRLILLAMLPLMSAGIDRIGFLPALQSAYFVRFLYLDLLLIPLVVYDFATVRRIHRITLIGAACIVVSQIVVTVAANSPVWYRFVYHAITPFVERVPEVTLTDAQSDLLLGDYGSKDWKMTVSRDGEKLYLQLPDQPKWEIGANSETALFLKRENWKLSFVKDSQGRVTKVINTHPDRSWEAARLP